MNILLRIVAVFVLLGSLAYGSYAVGRYVLSEKLFGSSVAVQPTSGLVASSKPRVTSRKVTTTGEKPPIEVQVLPADQAESGPDVSSIRELQPSSATRRSSTPAEKPKIVNANTLGQSRSRIRLRDSSGGTIFGQSGVESDDDNRRSRRSRRFRERDGEREDERPRRRRRKRRVRSNTTTVVADSSSSRASSTRSSESQPARSESRPSRRNSSDDSGSSRSSSGSSNDSPARSSGDSTNGPF